MFNFLTKLYFLNNKVVRVDFQRNHSVIKPGRIVFDTKKLTFYFKEIFIFIKFKKNYKYFSYFNYKDLNYRYTTCTKRVFDDSKKTLKIGKSKLTFENFLKNVFKIYIELQIFEQTYLIFSNFLISFFKSFENFFKKNLINSSLIDYIVFFFFNHKYKFKKVKTCKKNMQKKILINYRKKENFLQ